MFTIAEHVGGSGVVVMFAVTAAAVTVSVKALFVASLTVPVQVAESLPVAVIAVSAPPFATHVLSSGIEAMAALTVALLFGSAFAPECSLWSHGFDNVGLIFIEPVETLQVTLLPGPAVIVVAPLALDVCVTKPTALSARIAPVAPSHFIFFTCCVSSVD